MKRKKKVNPRKEGWNKEVRGPVGGRRRKQGGKLRRRKKEKRKKRKD